MLPLSKSVLSRSLPILRRPTPLPSLVLLLPRHSSTSSTSTASAAQDETPEALNRRDIKRTLILLVPVLYGGYYAHTASKERRRLHKESIDDKRALLI